jgi:OmcA/MtrC family decaheme c-type cytochrome
MLSSAAKTTGFSPRDKAFYADPNVVAFVRPGLTFKIVSARIATDGTITVSFKVTDPKGLGLDRTGVFTPGTVSSSFLVAYIPKGQTQFVSYATRTRNSPDGKPVLQAGADSGGTYAQTGDGEYTYTFATKAPKDWDQTATHRVAVYGNRNLTEFDLGTSYDDDYFTWVPAGGTPEPRDVIKTETCNKCHDQLAFHGGSRRSMEVCTMCHTPQTPSASGPATDFKVMIHKIHAGDVLPSVEAGGSYKIGNSDWSSVAFPADVRRCESCHEPDTGAKQADAWLKPSRAACGSCHDNVNFATGENHLNLPQVSDTQCVNCHIPKGETDLDVSIRGAHTLPQEVASKPGIVVTLVKVDDGVAGRKPTVTFTLKDSAGNPIEQSAMTLSTSRLSLLMTGPTTDYGAVSFGPDVTTRGYVSEAAAAAMKCSGGTCTYTFNRAIPADAKGTFAIGVEARRSHTILPGTVAQTTTNYAADNKVIYFSVDGTPVTRRREVVSMEKCNSCHTRLALHGQSRNQADYCVFCHNPNNYSNAAPQQPINFAVMAHRIHFGENGSSYKFGNTDFKEVRYPAFSPNGRPGDTTNCGMCHVNGSEAVFPQGLLPVKLPGGLMEVAPATTAACTACHQSQSALAHAASQTDPNNGESCNVCHGAAAEFSVLKVHAK